MQQLFTLNRLHPSFPCTYRLCPALPCAQPSHAPSPGRATGQTRSLCHLRLGSLNKNKTACNVTDDRTSLPTNRARETLTLIIPGSWGKALITLFYWRLLHAIAFYKKNKGGGGGRQRMHVVWCRFRKCISNAWSNKITKAIKCFSFPV